MPCRYFEAERLSLACISPLIRLKISRLQFSRFQVTLIFSLTPGQLSSAFRRLAGFLIRRLCRRFEFQRFTLLAPLSLHCQAILAPFSSPAAGFRSFRCAFAFFFAR
jgi:hypothetical protein